MCMDANRTLFFVGANFLDEKPMTGLETALGEYNFVMRPYVTRTPEEQGMIYSP